MGELIWQKRGFKVVNETEKGTKITATKAVIAFDDDINLEAEFDERSGSGLYMGNSLVGQPGIAEGSWNPKVEMRSAGSAAMESGLADMLQACGFLKSSESYTTHSSPASYKTLSVDGWEDGEKKGLRGAMGNVIFTADTGKKMLCEFAFKGVYQAHADQAMPTFTQTSSLPMKMQSGLFTIGGTAKRISRVSLDMKMEIQPLYNPAKDNGIEYYMIGYGTPEISFDVEAELVATYDIYSIWAAGTTAAIIISVNDGTYKATFTMPKVQYKSFKEGKRENLRVNNCVGMCLHSSGNDSVTIAVAVV